MFIQHLAETTHNVVKAERKPRRNIQYRDVSSAVSKTDNLEFLVDVVPKTITFKEFKKRQEAREKAAAAATEGEGEGVEKYKGKGKGKSKESINGTAAATATNGTSTPVATQDITSVASSSRAGGSTSNVVHGEPNGHMPFTQDSTRPEEAPEDMDVDEQAQDDVVVPDSEPEEDAVAMQLEMEMRGPPRPTVVEEKKPEVRRTSGFTAVNGKK